MPRIDFYVIPESTEEMQLRFACRVLEKAYEQKHQVYVNTTSAAQAYQLNDLLWTFHDTSFIPHHIVGERCAVTPPIVIGFAQTPEQHDVLMNLDPTIPNYIASFGRIIEIVIQEKESQKISREHYRYYQEQGFEINTHNLTKQEQL